MNQSPPQLFAVERVQFEAKLTDGRTLKWSIWAPNKGVDAVFGTVDLDASSYPTTEEFEEERVKEYWKNGFCVENAIEKELIFPDKLTQITTSVDKKSLSIAEIVMRGAHVRDGMSEVTVRPTPQNRPSIQEIADALDRFMKGTATLNDFFSTLRQPARPEPDANVFVKPTQAGFVRLSDGKSVNLRPLFSEEMLFSILEIRRMQILQGL